MLSDKISELAHSILKHKNLYYKGTPEISDAEYDKLEDELRLLAPKHPALEAVGSEESISKKVEHAIPMLSLSKTYDIKDLMTWVKEKPVVATLKIDGNSMSLVYKNGSLSLAKTRGNGRYGEDVTDKIHWVSDCIVGLDINDNIEIRGELYCTESNFLKLTSEMQTLGLELPTNPRNIVSGILGRKQHINLARFFSFTAFDIIDSTGHSPFKTEIETFSWLKKHGFKTPEYKLLTNEQEILHYLDYAKDFMEEDEIGIDGVVFSYNDISLHKELGSTAHHPRYKMSFKWQGSTAISKIIDFTWMTSRLGIITPVAVIEPTELSGATISHVTLHNAQHVKLFNLKVDDEIEIVRSGEVIPKFLRISKKSEGHYTWPSDCPSCHGHIDFDGIRLICKNTSTCPAQQSGAILNWIKCVGIDDLSEKRVVPMIETKLITSIPDLYKLTVKDLLKLPLTKDKMAQKLFNNIQKSKNIALADFLNGLGIAGAGLTTWESLLKVYNTLDKLLAATEDQLITIDGFAEKSAAQIVGGLKEKSNLIKELLSVGVTPKAPEIVDSSQLPLNGKTIVITGTLSRPRGDFTKAIKKAGGKMGSSVSKNTFALIIADPESTSSKAKKARELGINLWDEKTFWKTVNE